MPLLEMTFYTVHRKGRSEAVQLRFVTNIHVSMCQAPYIETYLFVRYRAVGTIGDATMLPEALVVIIKVII